MNKFLVETFLPWAGTVIGGVLLPLLALELKKFIAAKVKNEKLRGVLERLTDSAADVVRDVSATTYRELMAQGGRPLDTAEREHLRATALSRLKTIAESDVKDLADLKKIDGEGGAMVTLLLAKIEAAVDEMKLAHVAAANATPVATVAAAGK